MKIHPLICLFGASMFCTLGHAQGSPDCLPPTTPTLLAPVILGNGNAGSVSTAQLQTALTNGGDIRLNIGSSTLQLTQQLNIGRAVTLDGNGASLSGNGTHRVIEFSNPGQASYTLNLLNVHLLAGNARNAAGNEFAHSGGALLNDHGNEPWRAISLRLFNVRIANSLGIASAQDGGGGGIYVVGLQELTLVNSIVENNVGSNGGGIYSLGTASIRIYDSTIRGNTASGTGGNPGNGGNAGGLGVDGETRQIRLCRAQLLDNNAGAFGGGLFTVAYDQASSTLIEDSTIAGNNSTASDKHTGGVYLQGGPISIRGSTFRDNQAAGFGGLALFDHQTVNGLISTGGEISNSTFVGNRARTSLGGAIGISATGALLLQNLTIADNAAECSVCFAGGIQNSIGTNITLRNSILHNNIGGNAFNPWNLRNPVNGSNNLQWPLVRPGSFGQQELPVTPNSSFAQAQLINPADNGGPTWTMALLATSPAINSGSLSGAPSVDQRGLPRDNQPDIGAFELQSNASLFNDGFESNN